MRNLKKILALVLALVMSLSLVTTAGAFSDDGSINADYQDAIDVLSKLEVFQGYSDGSFKPQGEITRAEVAAIIYRIVTADVKDNQKEIYSTWGKFTDVQDGAWFAGYVNYCANAGYIKGRGNNKFDPQANVTGYEALAMILRAVGYDKNGEFTGSDWQVRTASTARERKILKNVTEGLLGQKASRELVAEILFRSIVIPKVDFNANTLSYKEKGAKETIGYESFKLEEITGVVIANEKAHLEANSPLLAGKVYMNVDGKGYTLNDEAKEASGFDALGEMYHAYIVDADKSTTKVLKIAKSDDSKHWETWENKEIGAPGDTKKFQETTGYLGSSSAVRLLNYGAQWVNSTEEVSTTDWRIRYEIKSKQSVTVAADGTITMARAAWNNLKRDFGMVLKCVKTDTDPVTLKAEGDSDETLNDKNVAIASEYYELSGLPAAGTSGDCIFVYSKTIKASTVSTSDLSNIEYIFKNADRTDKDVLQGYISGEVYVGTSSLKDVSDNMSYTEFKKTYIIDGGGDVTNSLNNVTKNERGNYLKVIDNNNDGYADYVLKTIYTMAQVVRAKDGEYGLDTRDTEAKRQPLCDTDGNQEKANFLDKENVKTEEGTLALGDIVYYCVVDGQGWAYLAESADIKVDTVNRADKKITASDGTEYFESGVCGKHVVSADYTCGVTNMNGYTTYTVYFDGAKNVALFTDSNNGDFTLIVDGWFNQTKNGVEYAAWTYNDETGRQELRDVTRGGSMFIDGTPTQNNDWNALKELGGATKALNGEGSVVKTTVATLTADGVLQPVDYSSVMYPNDYKDSRVVRMIATDGNKIPNSGAYCTGTAYSTSYTGNNEDAYNSTWETGVEVRALGSTVYYVVYPLASSESDYAVERYVGYNNVPKIESNIEDVYVVGTRQNRDSNLGVDEYYTANVVVIEMERWTNFADQVFIYNMPEANSSVSIEKVDVIRENGEKETILVDFEASGIRGYHQALTPAVGSVQWTNWGPGLYYITNTNRADVYTIKRMNADEIAANGYVTGYVATSAYTASDKYVEAWAMSKDTTTGAIIGYSQESKDLGNIYRLGYNKEGIADLAQYNANEGDILNFLNEKKNINGDATDHWYGDGHDYCASIYSANRIDRISKWDWNRVLIHYVGGVAQYVVSFNGTKTNKDGNGLAWDLWEKCLPSTEAWKNVNNRADAIRYAQFMLRENLNKYGFNNFNITPAVKADMAKALYNNAKYANDTEAANLIAQLVYEALYDQTAAENVTASALVTRWNLGDVNTYAQKANNGYAAKINALVGTGTEPAQQVANALSAADAALKNASATVDDLKDAKKNLETLRNLNVRTDEIDEMISKLEAAIAKQEKPDPATEVKVDFDVKDGVKVTGIVGKAAKNGSFDITVTAVEGYSNPDVSVTGAGAEAVKGKDGKWTINVGEADVTVTVTATKDAEPATIEYTENGAVVKGTKVESSAANFEIEVEAQAGYDANTIKVTVDGKEVTPVDGKYTITVPAGAATVKVVLTAALLGGDVNETTNVTLKYAASVITKDLGQKEIVNNVLELTYDDVMPAKKDGWLEVKPLVITDLLADGATAAKGEAGGWKLTVTKSTGGSIEITVDWTTEIVPTEKSTSRRARAGEEGKTLSAEVSLQSEWKLSTDYENDKFWVTMGGITISNTEILTKGEEWNLWQITAVTTGDYSSERGAYITTFPVSADDTKVEDTSGVAIGTELKPTGETWNEVSADGNQVTVTEFQTEDGSLTINQKVELIEDAGENGEDITKSTFDVTASGADNTENMKTPDEVVSNEKFSLSDKIEEAGILESDQDALVLNQFTATGPAGSEPQVEIDRSVYDVVCVSEEGKVARAGEDSVKWFIYIVLKVEKGTKTPVGEVKAEISFTVSFEEPEPVIEAGALKVEALTDLERIDFENDKIRIRLAAELQEGLTFEESTTENNTRVAHGVALYHDYTEAFGATNGKGYFIAFKMSCDDANAKIYFKSSDGKTVPGLGSGYKALGDDGILVWRLTDDEDGNRNNITVNVSGDEYTIDLSDVSEGRETDVLTVTPFGADESIVDDANHYKKTGEKIQNITRYDTDEKTKTVTVEGTTEYITSWPEYSASNNSGFFVALKFEYPGVKAKDMEGVYGTRKMPLAGENSDSKTGVALIKLVDNDNGRQNFQVKVAGKTYTVDLTGVREGSMENALDVKAVEQSEEVYGRAVSAIQSPNTTVEPVDGSDTKFKATGELYYQPAWEEWSSETNINTGYFVALDFEPAFGAIETWDELTLTDGTAFVDNPENTGGWLVKKVTPGETKDVQVKMKGVTYTVDLSELRPVSPLTVKATGANEDMGKDYGNLKASDFCQIECNFVDDGVNDTIEVIGEAYYVSPMEGFATAVSKGWFVALDFGGIVNASGKIEIEKADSADGSKGSGEQTEDFTFLRKIYVDLTGNVPNGTVKAFGKTFKLDLSKVERLEKLDAKEADQTTKLTNIGAMTFENGKSVSELQGANFRAVADMYTRTITLSGDVYKLTGYEAYQSNDNNGYFVVIDMTYPTFCGDVTGITALRPNGIQLNKKSDAAETKSTESDGREEEFGWICKIADTSGNFFENGIVIQIDKQRETQWRVVDGGLNFTEAPKTAASN